MVWTLDKIDQVEDPVVKFRLFEEFKKRGAKRPLTGDLDYWNRVVYLKDVDFRRSPEFYVSGKGHQGVLSTEPYSSEIKPHYSIESSEKSIVSADSISELFFDYLGQDDYVGCDICRKFLSMGRMRNKFLANQMEKKFNFKKTKILDVEKHNERIESSLIFQSFYHGIKDNKKFLFLKKRHNAKYSEI